MNFKIVAAALAGISLSVSMASAQSDQSSELIPETGPWHNRAEVSDRAIILGNPEASVTLTEFISYTCGSCARFAIQGDPTIEYAFTSPGKLKVEFRPVIRNSIDLVITMLAQCGDPKQFKSNHAMFLRSQGSWLAQVQQAPQSQQAIWARGDANGRLNAARALDLDDTMTKRGYTLPQINACLKDETRANTLIANSAADSKEFGINATPSFAIDGETLDEVHSWNGLFPLLTERLAQAEKPAEGTLPRP